MAAKAYGMDHFVRLPATDYASVMRPLEAGAGGVMVSMVRSAEEAEQAVRWAKFWPRGERGLNGGNRDGRFGLTPLARVRRRGQRLDLRRHPDRDRRRTRRRWPRSPRSPTSTCCSSARPTSARCWACPAISRTPGASRPSRRSPAPAPRPASPGASSPEGPSTPTGCATWGCRMFVLAFDIHTVHAGIRAGQGAVRTVFPGSLNLRSCAAFPAHCGGAGTGGCPSRPEKRLCRELPILASTPLLTRR